MKKKQKKDISLPDLSNPYLNGRREWNERYGDFIAAAAQWRFIALFSLLLSGMCLAGLIYFSGQNHMVPYVIEVDKLGASIAVNKADRAAVPDKRIIRAQLARWIVDVRSVYLDTVAENKIIHEAYAMVNQHGASYNVLNDYFRSNDPFKKAQEQSVNVAVQSVLPISDNTWRIEWREEVRSRGGHFISENQWQAVVTIVISPPTNEDVLFANPMGIYIDSFSWSNRV